MSVERLSYGVGNQPSPQFSSRNFWLSEHLLPPFPNLQTYDAEQKSSTYLLKKISLPLATTLALTFPHGSAGWGMTCRQLLGSPYCTYRVHTYSVHTACTLMTVHRNFKECRCRLLPGVSSCNGCYANHALTPSGGDSHERHPWGGKNDACPGSKLATPMAAKWQERIDGRNVTRLLVIWNWCDLFFHLALLAPI